MQAHEATEPKQNTSSVLYSLKAEDLKMSKVELCGTGK
jgi:hypothetical protein